MADLSILTTRLAEAEAAYHKLLTGSLEETVMVGDIRTTYAKSEAAKLQSYIDNLKSQIAAAGGAVAGLRRRGLMVNL